MVEKLNMNYFKKIIMVLFFSLVICSGWTVSFGKSNERTQGLSVGKFGRIMVLENGRKKPMDTYARNKLLQFSGRQRIKGFTATEWIVRLILNPESTNEDLVFLINNPDVANALGVTPRTKRRYSFRELYGAISKIDELSRHAMEIPTQQWSSFEKEIVQTRANVQEYMFLSSTFSFADPQEIFTITDSVLAQQVGLPLFYSPSYLELLSVSKQIAEIVRSATQKSMDSLSDADRAIIAITRTMLQMETEMKDAAPHIIPFNTSPEEWISLWGVLAKKKSAALTDESVTLMMELRKAYLNRNQQAFDAAITTFIDHIYSPVKGVPDPALELLYNKWNPFFWSKIMYGFAVLLSLFAVTLLWKRAYPIGLTLVIMAMLLHSAGIAARMIIMHHPPVTNLYETFVFTAWASVLLGIILEIIRIKPYGVLLSAITGFLFLHIAGRYAKDGDTLGMLSAVLDSSFWLTTHIVTISLGYAGYVGAGLMAHVYLIMKCIKKMQVGDELKKLKVAIYGMLAFGFIFTIIGTVFGGMWADQAWGRFWGWDPKENGALLIILWGVIVLHGNKARLLGQNGIAYGAVIGMILVMMTWIGVNLLGVGLHSYGFSSVGANSLLTYTGIEVVFLIIISFVIRGIGEVKKPASV
jgi:ABC-type transport system involved in cytochrome c biogenesis permease subunit